MTAEESVGEITAIEKQANRARYNVYVNGQYRLSVHEDVLVKHRLMKGAVVNERQLASVLYDEERQKAMHTALRYVGRKARSVLEVKQKLASLSYEESFINSAVDSLLKQGILNDQEFAMKLAEYRFYTQKKGKRWIEQELKQKGIASEHIFEAVSSIHDEMELDQAISLAEKKWHTSKGSFLDKKRKTLSYLLRRGVPQDIALKAVQTASADDGDQDQGQFHLF